MVVDDLVRAMASRCGLEDPAVFVARRERAPEPGSQIAALPRPFPGRSPGRREETMSKRRRRVQQAWKKARSRGEARAMKAWARDVDRYDDPDVAMWKKAKRIRSI